jgi:oxazoline/thiazoline dehydrogenase
MKIRLKLKSGYSLNEKSEKRISLKFGTRSVEINTTSPEIAKILMKLNIGIPEEEIYSVCQSYQSSYEGMQKFITSLKENCCLDYCFYGVKDNLCPFEVFIISPKLFYIPRTPINSINLFEDIYNSRYKLSRFSYFRSVGNILTLENPSSKVNIFLKDAQLFSYTISLLAHFSIPNLLNNLSFHEEIFRTFIDILLENGFIVLGEETEEITHKMWSFFDFLFHKSSRMQEAPYPPNFGSTFPYLEFSNHFSKTKSPMVSSKIELNIPCFLKLQERDPSLTHVLENRQTRRFQGQHLITKDQLSELLYRVFHIKKSSDQQKQSRVYPNAGGQHEFEVYLLVNKCEELETNLYHYYPGENGLYPLDIQKEYIAEMLKLSSIAWGNKDSYTQVLIILSSRFPRQFWKYEGIGYRNTLINAGTIVQTIYLVAEAMNLAVCCLGYGCSDLFSKAIRTNAFEESSVLEIALGSRMENSQG